ncbi:MAG: O-antigen ligase family protein [Bacillota bacterium]
MTSSVSQQQADLHISRGANIDTRSKGKGVRHPKIVIYLFLIFAGYMVLPLIDVPLLGLSLSAPIFFVIFTVTILRPQRVLFHASKEWIIFAVLIWTGIFISAMANGLLSGGVNIDSDGISLVIHYAYWLLVFVFTAYFASQGNFLKRICVVLGWAVLILALFRWMEVVLYGNYGAWSGTKLISQNTYGFLFSTFSPFLLLRILEGKGRKRVFALFANLTLWAAAAINGSRGSWVAIGVGLALCLTILAISRPGKFAGLAIAIIVIIGMAGAAWAVFPQVAASVTDRFNSFQTLDQDKSYMIRQLMIQKGLRLFEQSPLIGVGASRFTKSSVPLDIPFVLSYASQTHFDVKSAHNSYLDFLAENGLVGAVPFGILLLTLAWGGLKSAFRSSRIGMYWMLAVFLSFTQMSIHMWSITSITNTANWFIYGLVAAVIIAANRKEVPA